MSGLSRSTQWRLTAKEKAKMKKNPQPNSTDVDQIFSSTANSSVSAIHQKLDNINQRIISLETSVASILETVNKLAGLQTAKLVTTVEFPLESLSDVEEMEKKIQENSERYIVLLRSALMPEGILKNFRRVLGLPLIMDFNYAGIFSKNGLSSYDFLNRALYEAVKRDGYTFEDYKRDVRLAFSREKNKFYKANCMIKKQQRQIKQIFVKEDGSGLIETIIPDEVIEKKMKWNVISNLKGK